MSLSLGFSPIIEPGELGNNHEESCVQMTPVQFRDRHIQLHGPGIVEG
jgi:hypothetical protein